MRDFKNRLDTQSPSAFRRHRHKLLVAGISILGAALALQFAADPADTTAATQLQTPMQDQVVVQALGLPPLGDSGEAQQVTTELRPALPAEDTNEQASAPNAETAPAPHAEPQPAVDVDIEPASASASPATRWVEYEIQSGDSLARIFKNQGLTAQLLHRITHSSDEAADLARIMPGQTLRFQFDETDQLLALEHVVSPISKLRISATDEGFAAEEIRKDVEIRIAETSGTITDSLFVDGQAAGLSDAQIMELAGIFGWDIDFALELRGGDTFSLIYEEHYLDGKKFRDGPILAAEFVNRGTSYRAVRFEDENGVASYYDTDGSSKRRAFIRTPVKFARVSSGFTNKRWHPVLQKWRSHKGVDYAAPTGTPIKATGSGKVIFRGWKGGYGKVVIIQHGSQYTTLYAHMSRFSSKVKNGSRVKQGQIIGYVGKTGLASGPHLHYEFRVNGVHRNPLTVKLPKSVPLPKARLAQFRASSSQLLAQLDRLAPPTVVAQADTSEQ
jgi:murein DD-endopeptidase MepM/ murein hydrolase activator NlpD